jgi:crotonobetainyl-CoA:carnitine CoA-transferase CaiB-like acyl-CoA transferase
VICLTGKRPLEGVKIVELSTFIAASSCGRMLADFGASVVKVEAPSGDGFRSFGRAYKCPSTEDCNPLFDTLNAGKKGLVLDLKNPDGLRAFHKLLAAADVFVTNTRNQGLVSLGLDYKTLMAKYPRLVVANLVAYGEKGAEVDRPGFDTMSFWTKAGFTHDIAVETDGNFVPAIPLMGAGDIACAMGLMAAILSALYAREKTGKGDRVSLSLYGTALWMGSMMVESTQYGHEYPKKRYANSPVGSPYLCADGKWFFCNVVNFPKDYPKFLRLMEHEELLDDQRYNNRPSMNEPEIAEYLIRLFEKSFIKRPSFYWKEQFEANDLCYELAQGFRDSLDDDTAWVNDYLYRLKHPDGRESIVVRPSLRSENMGLPEYGRGPILGEHSVEVLLSLGYSYEDIQKLADTSATKLR